MDKNNAAEEPVEDEEIMTDADFERAMEQMAILEQEGGEEINDLLMAMSDAGAISWEEAERILGNTSNEPVKSSLPQQTRPTEPDNETDVDSCVSRLMNNDPKLVEINLNNMKRTPVPKVKRMLEACRDNEYLEKLSLANMGLYDLDVQPLIDILEHNTTLRCVNLETNYLSGDFFARLFKAALTNQTLEEVKAVNQGVAFSTSAEREIIDAISQNRGMTKVSINLRLPEGRFKIEKATIRNQEIRRILRRQEAAAKLQAEAKGLTTRLPKEEEKKTTELARKTTPSQLAVAGAPSKPKAAAAASSSAEPSKPREAAKPRESRKSSVLLADRLKETGVELETSVAARRAKFGEKAKPEKSENVEKPEKAPKAPEKPAKKPEKEPEKPVDGVSSTKPKYVPSWREKLADRDAKAKEFAEALKTPAVAKTPEANSQQNDVDGRTKKKKMTGKTEEAEVDGKKMTRGKKTGKTEDAEEKKTERKKTVKTEDSVEDGKDAKKTTTTTASQPTWRDRLNAQK